MKKGNDKIKKEKERKREGGRVRRRRRRRSNLNTIVIVIVVIVVVNSHGDITYPRAVVSSYVSYHTYYSMCLKIIHVQESAKNTTID